MSGDPIRAVLQRLVDAFRIPGQSLPIGEWIALAEGALAAPTPSLAELVNPQPGYQPGTGREDGAQLVGPEWWAPEFGCDSLDITLDAIRDRIAPYLREPVGGVDVPGPDGDYGDVLDLCAAEGVDPQVGVPLLQRARKAWDVGATPTPPADGEAIGPEWRPCVKLPITVHVREQRPGETHVSTREGITPVKADDLIMRGIQGEEYLIGRELFDRTYQLGPAPASAENITPPADGEAEELAQWLEKTYEYANELGRPDWAQFSRRAAALLRQLPPEGLEAMEYYHTASGARVVHEPCEGKPGECWTVRNHRHVNPCTEFPTLAAAGEALQQARQEGSDD